MKKLSVILIVAFIAWYAWDDPWVRERLSFTTPRSNESELSTAFARRQSDVQVQGQGEVLRVLPDDNVGSRHQRFILRLESGQTVLVAHNIDLAPRVAALRKGDLVKFRGEYEWNEKGGVIHWTHHDPRGSHVDGWLKHGDRTYK